MSTIRALGEVALRVKALDPMHDFYANVVRLELCNASAVGILPNR